MTFLPAHPSSCAPPWDAAEGFAGGFPFGRAALRAVRGLEGGAPRTPRPSPSFSFQAQAAAGRARPPLRARAGLLPRPARRSAAQRSAGAGGHGAAGALPLDAVLLLAEGEGAADCPRPGCRRVRGGAGRLGVGRPCRGLGPGEGGAEGGLQPRPWGPGAGGLGPGAWGRAPGAGGRGPGRLRRAGSASPEVTAVMPLQVRLAIAEKALKCEEHDVNLPLSEHNEPWFMRLNSSGEVPVLIHGENIICEATQIIDYLEATFVDGNPTGVSV